jgi:hypothetical protein
VRKAVALLVTIALITVLFSLVGIAAAMMTHTAEVLGAEKRTVQSVRFAFDLAGALSTVAGDINDSTGLELLLDIPWPVESEKAGFSASVVFTSLAYAPNVNRLVDAKSGKMNEALAGYLDAILTYYGVSDKIFFLDLLADTIDKDTRPRVQNSEIAEFDTDFTQGGIFGPQQWRRIVAYYIEQTGDSEIASIDWSELIAFEDTTIDFNRLSPEALRFMLPGASEDLLKQLADGLYTSFDELPLGPEDVAALKRLDIGFFSPLVEGDMRVRYPDGESRIVFGYDLKMKKVTYLDIRY